MQINKLNIGDKWMNTLRARWGAKDAVISMVEKKTTNAGERHDGMGGRYRPHHHMALARPKSV
jgi:hypothetical protein